MNSLRSSEEIFYRAVIYGLFYELTGNYWSAAIISATFFGIAHHGHGIIAASTTFFVALGLQYLVMISDGLYVAIAIHFIHNVVNGIVYGALWKRKYGHTIIKGLAANV